MQRIEIINGKYSVGGEDDEKIDAGALGKKN